MAYNQNIPQPSDQLKNSQPQFLANFQEINTALNVNHVGFNVGDEGKHKFMQMPEQVAPPVTNASEIALFSFLGTNSGVTELNFKRDSNPLTSIPFTEGLLATPGWTILPCGLVVKWGSSVLPSSGGPVTSFAWNVVLPVAGNIREFTQPPFLVLLSATKIGAPRLFVNYYWNSAATTAVSIAGISESIASTLGGSNIASYTINYLAIGI